MMVHQKVTAFSFTLLFLCLFVLSCNDAATNEKGEKIVADPEQIDKAVRNSIEQLMGIAVEKKGNIDDSSTLKLLAIVSSFYQGVDFENQWSKKEKWLPLADSLVQFIRQSEVYGLFPKDYHAAGLDSLKQQLDRDSVKRMDAVSWAKADVLLTDACITIIKDLKFGRLFYDSSALSNDTTRIAQTLIGSMKQLLLKPSLLSFMNSLEPGHRGYAALKSGIRYFLDSMDRRTYTYVVYPYKKNDVKDSLFFIKTLQKRLAESNCINFTNKLPDSTQLDQSIRNYQKLKGVKADGKLSSSLVKLLNASDAERFKRIAITLDRYKKLPDSMPQKFIWVNLPGYYLQLWDSDTIALESKIICGKTSTPTPLLNSAISDMITYPTWTVPTSIISKQYLPKLKNNPNYLSRLGLRLVNEKGESVSASTVNWGKYTKGIPYKVMQNSGDNNALGVIKFNFSNPHAVYLHDTNQRYLFKNASRAFSHGCVRVQEWEKLAMYIARNDSMNLRPGDTLRYTTDSIRNWLAEKKHKRITVKNRLPLYITYFSCEGKDGKIKFYEDIYGDDKAMREKYFSNK
jgi:murein L,D-transpeptidase YcbB/YkuD